VTACRQRGCLEAPAYMCAGPHGLVPYCPEHAAKYLTIMRALDANVEVMAIIRPSLELAAQPERIQ
jgi:hypothetical protein